MRLSLLLALGLLAPILTLSAQRNRPAPQLEGIDRTLDLDYVGEGNPRQCLDLYLPKDRAADAGPLPLIVFIHGGGWQNGDKASGGRRLARLVATGRYAGASIGYRLSDEAQWPAQIHDCRAGLRWLGAHAKDYGIDPKRVAVWGASAGGHLVAMLGVTHGVEGLEGDLGEHDDQSSAVTCVVNFFGPADFLTMDDHPSKIDHDAPGSPESKLLGGPLLENRKKANNASPLHHVTADDRPSLIVHGTRDELVPYPQSVVFEKALEKAGVSTTLLTVEEGGHGGGFGPAVDKAVISFLAHHLHGEGEALEDATVQAGE